MAYINGQEVNDAIIIRNTGGGDIPDGAVTTAKLEDGAVTTPKIADGAVTAAKLASGVLGHTYSTDEQVIGSWIDGKPIYEKTVIDTTSQFTTNRLTIAHGISNFGNLININGTVLYGVDNDIAPIPYTNYDDDGIYFSWVDSVNINIDKVGTFSSYWHDFSITIQYTKTTDTANS